MQARLSRWLKNPIGNLRQLGWRTLAWLQGLAQKPTDSYRKHNAQFMEPDSLEKHRRMFAQIQADDLFNHSENKFGALLARFPAVRGIAVDIGCGGGWLAARLAHEGFARVIGIEPSATGLDIARELFPPARYPQIEWRRGLAEEQLPLLMLDRPTLFVTGCVLAHLTDDAVAQICATLERVAPVGSILGFSEPWGPAAHRFMWHVRTPAWWCAHLPSWKLDFHGTPIENVPGRHKGFHGVRVR